jgi:hypothetical protein
LPELPVSLEVIYARQNHAITVTEVLATTVDRLDRDWNSKVKEIRGVATDLSSATMRLLTARAIGATIPATAQLLVLGVGTFCGSFAATWIWLSLHSPLIKMAATTLR